MTSTAVGWEELRDSIAGEVVLPDMPAYESTRRPALANFRDVRPQAVVLCEGAEDVSETIRLARRCGLPTATRAGGHCFAGRSSTRGIVLDVTPMRSVSVSEGAATIGAGALLDEVYDGLDEHGLTIPAGCGPTVGIAGLTLGGGLGVLGRRHGLTSDSLLWARVVLADGRITDCDAHRHEDLFWALRGSGGGNFGVVTSLVFETLPAPPATAFHLAWPHHDATALIDTWQHWAPAAPEDMAASLLLVAPDEEDRSPMVNLFGAMIGAESATRELLDAFVARARADPSSVFLKHGPYRDVKRYLAKLGAEMAGQDDRLEAGPDEPHGHLRTKSEFFRGPLPHHAVEALAENLADGRVVGQSRKLDFTPWGGAYNGEPAAATAFAHREERCLLQHTVIEKLGASADGTDHARRWLKRSWDLVHPWGSGGVYPNWPDPELAGWARAYHGTNLDRLLRVKAQYDPDGFFRFHQSIPVRRSDINGRKLPTSA